MYSKLFSSKTTVICLIAIAVIFLSNPTYAYYPASFRCPFSTSTKISVELTTKVTVPDPKPGNPNNTKIVTVTIPGTERPELECSSGSQTIVSRYPEYKPGPPPTAGVFGDDWVDADGKHTRIKDVDYHGKSKPKGLIAEVNIATTLAFISNNSGTYTVDDYMSSMHELLGEGEFLVPYLTADTDLYVGVDLRAWIEQGGTFVEGQVYDLFNGTSPLLPGFIVGTSEIYFTNELGLTTDDALTGSTVATADGGIDGRLPESSTFVLLSLGLASLSLARKGRKPGGNPGHRRTGSFRGPGFRGLFT